MQDNSDASAPGSPTDEFELVTRKRRGKRNTKGSRSHNLNEYNGSRNPRTNHNSRNEDYKVYSIPPSNIIFGEPYVENEVNFVNNAANDMNLITTDASLFKPPTNCIEELPVEESNKPLSPNVQEEEQSFEEPVTELMNTRPLSKFAKTYELEKFKRNALLVFNQKDIEGYKPRLGTEKDVAELERTFKNFGFEVEVENDLKRDEIMSKLKEFTSRDFTDYGCVAIAVLTHGSKDGRIKAKDGAYSELEIVNHLQVRGKPTLVTKPRIVIIQACRGTKSIKGVPVGQVSRIQTDLVEEIEPYTLPVEADMLVLHSSYIGKVSHRHELLGSWFIQTLCSKINQLADELDLEDILTEVKRDVAIDKYHEEYNRRTYEYDMNKQMPVSTSTLIRKLYLKKFGDPPPEGAPICNALASTTGQDNTAVDNSSPNTPMLVQYGPCSCFLHHFVYIKDCLSHFVAENPDDTIAQSYLAIANTFEEGDMFNSAKEEMAKSICNHLRNFGVNSPFFKFLYFYKH